MGTPQGIHHVTAIASDPQRNIDFYSGLLGLRMVKKTVNFDDPSAYHLYYGDETGSPGTIVTFFYWPGLDGRGKAGSGQMGRISFSAPLGSIEFWQDRLKRHGVATVRQTRFAEDVLAFADRDGIALEIVSAERDRRAGWAGGGIPAAHALRGLHTAELASRLPDQTERLLTVDMGYRLVRRDEERSRFEAGPGGPGTYIDLLTHRTASGISGVGTIHHIAWRVPGDEDQASMNVRLARAGHEVSPVRDRTYFRSIYYREPGGILFEIATDTPGFSVDEPAAALGSTLKLPEPFETSRDQIEKALPPLKPARLYA